MRRFLMSALLVAALIAFLSPNPPESPQNAGARIGVATVEPPKAEPSSSHARPAPAAPAPQAAAKADILAPALRERVAVEPPQAQSEQVAVAHIPSSAKAGGIDAARPEPQVADADLASTAQRELTRLGCYGAGVDGVWGRQSRAAAQRFGQRAGGALKTEPSRDLISALRAAPSGFCTDRCAAGQCALAAARPPVETAAPGGEESSYLPPWMQGAAIASAEPDAVLPDAPPAVSGAGQVVRQPQARAERRAPQERRTVERAERAERPRSTSTWNALEGWPGTSR